MCGLFRAIKLSGQWNIAVLLGNQQKAFKAEGCLICRFRDWLHGEFQPGLKFQPRFWNKWNWRFGMTREGFKPGYRIFSLGKRAEKCEKIPRNRNGILARIEKRAWTSVFGAIFIFLPLHAQFHSWRWDLYFNPGWNSSCNQATTWMVSCKSSLQYA